MCMNYVEGGTCHVTGSECLLGTPHEINRRCTIRGNFDVWITRDDKVLISDIGPPSPEPKRSVALGVGKEVADEIAVLMARKNSEEIITAQQRCRQCGGRFWITDHDSSTVTRMGRRYFCPKCIERYGKDNFVEFDVPEYWCG